MCSTVPLVSGVWMHHQDRFKLSLTQVRYRYAGNLKIKIEVEIFCVAFFCTREIVVYNNYWNQFHLILNKSSSDRKLNLFWILFLNRCTLLVLIDFWIINLEFCVLNFFIFYQKLLWNIRSRLNSSTFWVFRPVFRYVWSKLKLFAQKMKILIKHM